MTSPYATRTHDISLCILYTYVHVLILLLYNVLWNIATYTIVHESIGFIISVATLKHLQDKKLITRWEYPNVTWRMSSYLFTYLRLSIDSHWTGTSIDTPLNLNLILRNMYSTLVCGLRSLLGPLYTIYRVISYLRMLALPVLTCIPNMSFLARLLSGNSSHP